MRHINILNDQVIVTQTSNSFGDQILTLRVLVTHNNVTSYADVKFNHESEGSWLDTKAIKQWAKQSMQKLFLDYVNNWLTLAAFSSYHAYSEATGAAIVNYGQEIHEALVEQYKKDKGA